MNRLGVRQLAQLSRRHLEARRVRRGGASSIRSFRSAASSRSSACIESRRSPERATNRSGVEIAPTEIALETAKGWNVTKGYDLIAKRDLETRYLYHPATTVVRDIDVKVPAGLNVGYVMGTERNGACESSGRSHASLITVHRTSSGTSLGRPTRGRSFSERSSFPLATKRARHLRTIREEHPTASATSELRPPSAVKRMMRAGTHHQPMRRTRRSA